MNPTDEKALLHTLRRKVEEQYRADLAAIKRMEALLNGDRVSLPQSAAQTQGRVAVPKGNGTHVSRVVEVLTDPPRKWNSAVQIAKMAQLDPAAVRTVLYTAKHRFEKKKLSPRKAVWKLKDTVEQAEQTP